MGTVYPTTKSGISLATLNRYLSIVKNKFLKSKKSRPRRRPKRL